jgi:hypothetical protein
MTDTKLTTREEIAVRVRELQAAKPPEDACDLTEHAWSEARKHELTRLNRKLAKMKRAPR